MTMWTFISVSLALVINFYNPEILENKKSIKNNYRQNKIITGFPYQYFKGEVLTDEMVEFRIQLIYNICFMIYIYITVTSSVGPTVGQAVFTSTATSIERLIPNQLDSQTNQQELLLDLRGGGNDVSEFIIRILLIWTMSQNSKPTEAFQPKPINQHIGFGRPGQVQPNPRIAPKLQENPVDRNNLGQGGGSCKANQYTSMDAMSNSLNPEFLQYQNDYYPKSLPQRFDTTQCPSSKFNQLAYD